jgi:hypothetical protein
MGSSEVVASDDQHGKLELFFDAGDGRVIPGVTEARLGQDGFQFLLWPGEMALPIMSYLT